MNPWTLPSAISATSTLAMLIYTMRRPPPARIWPALVTMMLACTLFAFGDWLTMLADTPAEYERGMVILYTGVILLMPFWWLVGVRFAESQGYPLPFGRNPVWTRAPIALGFVLLTGMITNPWHGQFIAPHLEARNDYQWIWYVHTALAYSIGVSTIIGFAALSLRIPRGQLRVRYRVISAVCLANMTCNAVYILTPSNLPFDPSATATGVTGIIFLAAIYGSPLFALSPFAITTVMRHASSGILVADDSGHLLYANPAAQRLFNVDLLPSATSIYPLLAAQLRNAKGSDDPVSEATLREMLDGPGQPEGSRVFRLNDSSERWVSIETAVIESRSGAPVGRSFTLQEITEIHRSNEALRQSEEMLRLVLDLVPYRVFAKDSEGRFIFINKAVAEASGTSMEKLLGHRIEDLVGDDKAASISIEQDRRVLEDGERVFIPEQITRDAGGQERTLQLTKIPVKFPDHPGPAMLGVAIDITEIKEAEQALQHSQKLESLGVMAGGIAHDFNNLLVAILGNVSLVLSEHDPESPTGQQLHDIEMAAQGAAELTRQLLAYAGKGRVEMEDLDLSHFARKVSDLLVVSIPSTVSVAYELADDLPAVHADPGQLRQVVMNLVINAADAIGNSVGRILISTSLVEVDEAAAGIGSEALEPGPHVMLSVSDTGVGMNVETKERIFDPFFTTKFAGRGLGLAAVLGIVHGHRGALLVDSSPGEGSTFAIYFPARDVSAQLPAREREAEQPGPLSAVVLLADDDASVLRIARRILEFGGLTVLTAEDGAKALEVFDAHSEEVELALLDVTMPIMDGLDAGRRLRERVPGLPIVISSGYPEAAGSFDLGGTGRTVFIQKPYAYDELLDVIADTLGGPSQSRDA